MSKSDEAEQSKTPRTRPSVGRSGTRVTPRSGGVRRSPFSPAGTPVRAGFAGTPMLEDLPGGGGSDSPVVRRSVGARSRSRRESASAVARRRPSITDEARTPRRDRTRGVEGIAVVGDHHVETDTLINSIHPDQLLNIISAIDVGELTLRYRRAAHADLLSGARDTGSKVRAPRSLREFTAIHTRAVGLQDREGAVVMAAAAAAGGEVDVEYATSADLIDDVLRFLKVGARVPDETFHEIEGLIQGAIFRQIEVTRVATSSQLPLAISRMKGFASPTSAGKARKAATASGKRMEILHDIDNPVSKQRKFDAQFFERATSPFVGALEAVRKGIGAGALIKALKNASIGFRPRNAKKTMDFSIFNKTELSLALSKKIMEYEDGTTTAQGVPVPPLATILSRDLSHSNLQARETMYGVVTFFQNLALLNDDEIVSKYKIDPSTYHMHGRVTAEDSKSIIKYNSYWFKLLALELVDLCRADLLVEDGKVERLFNRHKQIYENLGLGTKRLFLERGDIVQVKDLEPKNIRCFPFTSAVGILGAATSGLEGGVVRHVMRQRADEARGIGVVLAASGLGLSRSGAEAEGTRTSGAAAGGDDALALEPRALGGSGFYSSRGERLSPSDLVTPGRGRAEASGGRRAADTGMAAARAWVDGRVAGSPRDPLRAEHEGDDEVVFSNSGVRALREEGRAARAARLGSHPHTSSAWEASAREGEMGAGAVAATSRRSGRGGIRVGSGGDASAGIRDEDLREKLVSQLAELLRRRPSIMEDSGSRARDSEEAEGIGEDKEQVDELLSRLLRGLGRGIASIDLRLLLDQLLSRGSDIEDAMGSAADVEAEGREESSLLSNITRFRRIIDQGSSTSWLKVEDGPDSFEAMRRGVMLAIPDIGDRVPVIVVRQLHKEQESEARMIDQDTAVRDASNILLLEGVFASRSVKDLMKNVKAAISAVFQYSLTHTVKEEGGSEIVDSPDRLTREEALFFALDVMEGKIDVEEATLPYTQENLLYGFLEISRLCGILNKGIDGKIKGFPLSLLPTLESIIPCDDGQAAALVDVLRSRSDAVRSGAEVDGPLDLLSVVELRDSRAVASVRGDSAALPSPPSGVTSATISGVGEPPTAVQAKRGDRAGGGDNKEKGRDA